MLNANSVLDTSITKDNYERLDFAEIACRNDTECFGVYDDYCDKIGPFLQIKKGFMGSGYTRHCIHKKKRYEGR